MTKLHGNIEPETVCTRLVPDRHADDRGQTDCGYAVLEDRLQLDHFVSRDPRGTIRQIVTALIVWGLLTIYNQGTSGFRPKDLMRQLRRAMEQALFEFGRRCQKHGVNPFG